MNAKPKRYPKRNRKYRDQGAHRMCTPLTDQQAAQYTHQA
jgi:hypothetical protein